MVDTTAPLQINKINKSQNDGIKKNTFTTTQYSVKQNVFNPDKFSPPNQWNIRLLNRFSKFESFIKCKNQVITI